jgi:hypothetical protein
MDFIFINFNQALKFGCSLFFLLPSFYSKYEQHWRPPPAALVIKGAFFKKLVMAIYTKFKFITVCIFGIIKI